MPLVLSRQPGETICIGNDVTVTVLGVRGNSVRVSVNAPKEIPVHREELANRIRAENGGQLRGLRERQND